MRDRQARRRSTSACRSTSAARRRRAAWRPGKRWRWRARSPRCRDCACAASWASRRRRPIVARQRRAISRAARAVRRLPRRRACASTRCRWGCRPISRPRSPRARRWCASAPRSSATECRRRSGGRGSMNITIHRRRQHGARAHRRAGRARPRLGRRFRVVEIDAEARATVAARFRRRARSPRSSRPRSAAPTSSSSRSSRSRCAQPWPASWRHCSSARSCLTIAAGIRLSDLSRWLLRLSAPRARDAQYAGADRRRHRGVYALAGVDGEGRARAAAVLEAVGGTSLVSNARTSSTR